ncbi:MAG: Ig-like domain-containing protein [Acutalibacteraceae bacterium]
MKKFLSLIIAAVLCAGVFAVQASAVTYPDNYPNTHKNTGRNLEDLIAVAKTQIGYTELNVSTGRPLSSSQDGGYTKYGAWFGAPTTAWCAFFVAWCSNQADISTSVIPRIGNCAAMVNWYSQKGRYHRASGFEPRTGDLIFYNWSGGSTAKHIGIVTGVSGNNVYTVEGNTGSSHGYRAEAKTRRKNASYIIGYARPDYNDAKTYIGSYSFAEYAAMKYKTASAAAVVSAGGAYTGSSKLAVFTGTVSEAGASEATLSGRISNSSGYSVSSSGFYFGASKNSMAAYKTNSSTKSQNISLSLNIAERLGGLEPGKIYYYCSYAVVKGKVYKGPVYSFKTADDRPQKIALSAENLTVGVGETYEIYSALLPLDAKDKGIEWSSDNEYVAKVSQGGVVKGVASGTAVITAKSKYGGASAQCSVTVTLAEVLKIETENVSPTQIKITWSDNDPDDLFGYSVYRSNASDGEYIKIADTQKENKTFTDSSLTPGESYYYKIVSRGITEEFDSDMSAAAYERALAAVPEVMSLTQSGAQIKVRLGAVDSAQEYRIYKSTSFDGEYAFIGTCTRTEFIDSDISAGMSYYYKAAASDGVALSRLSEPCAVTAGDISQPESDMITSYIFGAPSFEGKERIIDKEKAESLIDKRLGRF